MPFVPFDSTVRAAIRYTCEGQNIVNTLWFRHLAEFGLNEVEDLANQLDLWAGGTMMPLFATTVVYQEVTVYDMRSADSFLVVNDDDQGQAGSAVGNPLPLNAAMTVTLQTARRGRSYRGRNYLSGFVEGAASATTFDPGPVSDVENAYENLILGDFTGIGWQLVVASRQVVTPPTVVGVTTPVISFRANPRIHKMGSRTR